MNDNDEKLFDDAGIAACLEGAEPSAEASIAAAMAEAEREVPDFAAQTEGSANDGADPERAAEDIHQEQPLAAESGEGKEGGRDTAPDDGKSKYGKFKNPQELLKAYGELEKEFTRRSQRLKELEDGMSPFRSEKEWKGAVDKFFEETPSARAFAKEIAAEIIAHPELKQSRNCFNIALTHVLIDKFRTPEQLMADGQFLKEYVLTSPAVKDAVIAEYLGSLRDGQPPRTMERGGMQIVAPARRPGTIEEAGLLFLKNNR